MKNNLILKVGRNDFRLYEDENRRIYIELDLNREETDAVLLENGIIPKKYIKQISICERI